MVERILEAVLIAVAILCGLQVFQAGRPADGPELSLTAIVRVRRFPVMALVVVVALAVGSLLEVFWGGALAALQEDGSGQLHRTFTAPFVQNGGVLGAVFNIVTAGAVVALLEWCWGRWVAAALWLVGAWAPVSVLAGAVGYHVSAAHVTSYGAGSSGATFFASAGLCVVLLTHGRLGDRWRGLLGPVLAGAMWALFDDGHGVVFLEGFLVSVVLAAVVAVGRIQLPPRRAVPASMLRARE